MNIWEVHAWLILELLENVPKQLNCAVLPPSRANTMRFFQLWHSVHNSLHQAYSAEFRLINAAKKCSFVACTVFSTLWCGCPVIVLFIWITNMTINCCPILWLFLWIYNNRCEKRSVAVTELAQFVTGSLNQVLISLVECRIVLYKHTGIVAQLLWQYYIGIEMLESRNNSLAL